MLTIKIPIWISSAYVTMCITSLPGSANRLPYLAAPVPIIAQRAALCQFLSVLSCKPGGQGLAPDEGGGLTIKKAALSA